MSSSGRLYARSSVFDRDDVLAVDVDGDVFELHAVEHVALEAPIDRSPFRNCFDSLIAYLAEPLPEPRRLRDDERERDDADDQRADERDDLQQSRWSCAVTSRSDSLSALRGRLSAGGWHVSPSERLADRKVDAEVTLLRLAVDDESGNRIELESHVDAKRADGRVVANAWTDVVSEVSRT